MLTDKQRRAVALLFELTDDEITRRLRIGRERLASWKRDPEFCQALCDYVKENRRTAVRFLSKRLVEAAHELEAMIKSDDERVKHKVIIDLLKASGLLAADPTAEEEVDGVGDLLKRIEETPMDEPEQED